MKALRSLVVVLTALAPIKLAADPYLLMAEEAGCYWCARWNEEIAHIYPKTDEGRTAPLRRYDLHSEKPDVKFVSRVRFTPTFVLVDEGREVGRIEGYPGEDFFWGLLGMMFERANISLEKSG